MGRYLRNLMVYPTILGYNMRQRTIDIQCLYIQIYTLCTVLCADSLDRPKSVDTLFSQRMLAKLSLVSPMSCSFTFTMGECAHSDTYIQSQGI